MIRCNINTFSNLLKCKGSKFWAVSDKKGYKRKYDSQEVDIDETMKDGEILTKLY